MVVDAVVVVPWNGAVVVAASPSSLVSSSGSAETGAVVFTVVADVTTEEPPDGWSLSPSVPDGATELEPQLARTRTAIHRTAATS